MATFVCLPNSKWKAIVRITGHKNFCRTGDTYKEVEEWAISTEVKLRSINMGVKKEPVNVYIEQELNRLIPKFDNELVDKLKECESTNLELTDRIKQLEERLEYSKDNYNRIKEEFKDRYSKVKNRCLILESEILNLENKYSKLEKLLLQEPATFLGGSLVDINVIGFFSGVYFLLDNKEVVYVGQSTCLYRRIVQHKDKKFDEIQFELCSQNDLNNKEQYYIDLYKPKYNRTWQKCVNVPPVWEIWEEA